MTWFVGHRGGVPECELGHKISGTYKAPIYSTQSYDLVRTLGRPPCPVACTAPQKPPESCQPPIRPVGGGGGVLASQIRFAAF